MRRMLAATVAILAMLSTVHANAWDGGYRQCLKTKSVRFDGTIVEAAMSTPALSTLVDLVIAANLVDALNAPGNLTVYAPTNDAFAAIPGSILNGIGSDIEILTAVLTYHVTPGYADPRRPFFPREYPTLQGQTVFLDFDGEPQVNQSNASCQAVRTNNGTVWVIDSVLLPQFQITESEPLR